MRILSSLFALLLLSTVTVGCSIIYKPDIQQGNVFDQDTLDQLKPGLTKEQVLALVGTPSVVSPFDQNEWGYVSSLQKRGGKIDRKTLHLTFENDVLASKEGEAWVQSPRDMLKQVARYPMVLHDKKKEAEERRKRGG
ncbi:MAG TPA: outer membrane protein assembly factor BamE [Rhodanobacteraceae bacterium]|nr:outer membrane protein assembly factor BamE [Rhodanobacteraceae bacterium]